MTDCPHGGYNTLCSACDLEAIEAHEQREKTSKDTHDCEAEDCFVTECLLCKVHHAPHCDTTQTALELSPEVDRGLTKIALDSDCRAARDWLIERERTPTKGSPAPAVDAAGWEVISRWRSNGWGRDLSSEALADLEKRIDSALSRTRPVTSGGKDE